MKKIFCLFIFTLSLALSPMVYSQEIIFYNDNPIDITIDKLTFSPNGDGVKDDIVFNFTLAQKDLKIKSWNLSIVDKNSKEVVYEFNGDKSLPEALVWNGKNKNNEYVKDGLYNCIFNAQINKENIRLEKNNILVDTVLPCISINLSLENVFLGKNNSFNKPVRIDLIVDDEHKIDFSKTKVEVENFKNKIIKTWTFEEYKKIPGKIVWNGQDDIYDKLVCEGDYKIILTAVDVSGNVAVISKKLSVLEFVQGDIEKIKVKEDEKALEANFSKIIYFEAGNNDLTQENKNSLQEIIEILNVYPANKVSIEGHSDSHGTKDTNLKLSYERAQSVYDYLVQNGIKADRLQVVGYGEENPVASNDTLSGRNKNRRVVVNIIKQFS